MVSPSSVPKQLRASWLLLLLPVVLVAGLLVFRKPAPVKPNSNLEDAAKNKDLDSVMKQVQAGASVNSISSAGHSALFAAASNGDTKMVEYLLQNGASPNADVKGKNTPLDAGAMAGSLPVVQLLISHGADIHPASNDGETPLHAAAAGGNVHIVKLLLDKGLDPNARRTVDHATPICDAASAGNWNIVEVLRKNGGDIDITGYHRRTPLTLTILTRHRDVARKFIAAGADINIADADGAKPVQYALIIGDWDLAMMLLPKTNDPGHYDRGGRNLMYYAAFYGAPMSVVNALLAAGVSPNEKPNVQSPLSIAEANKDQAFIDALKKAGATD